MAPNLQWLVTQNLQELFSDFPMPLALMNPDSGANFTNKEFDRCYSRKILFNELIRQLAQAPDHPSLQITLPDLNDHNTRPLIHAIPMATSTLLVFDNTPGGVPDDEITTMRHHLAELEKLSATDVLTGAWNRVPLEGTVRTEIKRSSRYHQPMSIIFFDIDHFKNINDTYGHETGDDVLKALVALIHNRIRETDTLYRWGGEEFVVLATLSDRGSATTLAEHLRQGVEVHEFPAVGKVTISLGVAEYLPGDDLEKWLQRADKAVYEAKNSGRNRVVTDPYGGSDIWNQDKKSFLVQLVWHPDYSCGNRTIDEEHFQLFEQSNTLIKMMLEDADKEQWLPHLDMLLNAVVEHFEDEEAILAKIEYPEFDEHQQLHAKLLRQAGALKDKAVSGEAKIGHLLEFVAYDVIAKHMLVTDRKYYPFIEQAILKKTI